MRRAAVGAALALLAAGCGDPPPVEVDGDRIRAMIAEVGARGAGAGRAREGLLELSRRSPEGRALAFRDADRACRAAAQRAREAGEAEGAAAAGGALDERRQGELARLVRARVEAEAEREALRELVEALSR